MTPSTLIRIFSAGLLFALSALGTADGIRERASFNDGWRFAKGDPADVGDSLSYEKLKPWLLRPSQADAPNGGAFAQPEFDDHIWRQIRLPHDWGIEGPFDQSNPGETGKLPWWGVAWYRKHVVAPRGDAGKKIFLDIDGAMSFSSVWLNGKFVGGRPYGYSSFQVDLTPQWKPGQENVVAIRLDNPKDSSRWYPGGGIYRNVWLVKTRPVHVGHWGVSITTPRVSEQSADVELNVEIANEADGDSAVSASTDIFDGRLKIGSMSPAWGEVPKRGKVKLFQAARISYPRLWSPASPRLYRAVTTLKKGGETVDVVETSFGVRSLVFDPKQGLLLNGKKTFLKGVCNHHDLGALGTAFNLRAAERQLQILKSMGFNALRTSHNPPAPELLDLCDRIGIFVMDEFTDTWTRPKRPNGYAKLFADWHDADLRGLVDRDRNHPCVAMWSIGNEVPEQGAPSGKDLARKLAAIVHEEDLTRPVTSGNDNVNAGFNGFQKAEDVFGYNYKPWNYRKFIEANPNIPLFGSETASTISSRGEYFFPAIGPNAVHEADIQISSYDLAFPGWATTPDTEFTGQDQNPTVFGEFVWTGFDYLGEPTPYYGDAKKVPTFTDPDRRAEAEEEFKARGRVTVPSRSSYFGIIDLAGFPKDRFYLYQARWRPDFPMAHILPHWNWPDRLGQVTPVFLYTSGDEAELFLNGKSLGRKKRGPLQYRLQWDDVVYQPGELRAVAYKDGRPWATDVVKTTGLPARLSLKADRAQLKADGEDLCFVTVSVRDSKGLTVPRSKNRITFEISGPGEIVATDNGDATDLEPFQAKNKRAFNGLCLVIVRTKKGEPGSIMLTAQASGLAPSELQVDSY